MLFGTAKPYLPDTLADDCIKTTFTPTTTTSTTSITTSTTTVRCSCDAMLPGTVKGLRHNSAADFRLDYANHDYIDHLHYYHDKF